MGAPRCAADASQIALQPFIVLSGHATGQHLDGSDSLSSPATKQTLQARKISKTRLNPWSLEVLIDLGDHVPGAFEQARQFCNEIAAALFLSFLEQHFAEAQDMSDRVMEIMARFDDAHIELGIRALGGIEAHNPQCYSEPAPLRAVRCASIFWKRRGKSKGLVS